MNYSYATTTALRAAVAVTFWTQAFCCQIRADAVVFQTSLQSSGGSGFGGGILEIGQSISLAGSARNITQIDLLLSNSGPAEEFRVRFYGLDSLTKEPSELRWESPPVPFPGTGIKVVSVAVPGILVSDTMAYTVAPLMPSSSHMIVRTDASEFPTIGMHESYWYRRINSNWRDDLFGNGTLGARLFAVPEPSQLFLLGELFVFVWGAAGIRSRERILA